MKSLYFKLTLFVLFIYLLIFNTHQAFAQRTYANNEATGASGLICLGCTVTNPGSAVDGNLQTYSVIHVGVGVAGSEYEDLIFGGTKPAAGTQAWVKLGSGDNLLSVQALGAITLQAYNGNTPVGSPIGVATLVTVLGNNNQVEVGITPAAAYDRIRVTLNGGLVGALADLYLYEGFFNGSGPVPCNSSIDELHGISAGLLNLGLAVGGVQNPQYAIDGNINTASTLNAGVGLVGAYAQQTIIFNNQSVLGDSVKLTLSIPQALIDAGVLSNISVNTYNGNTDNGDTQILSASLLYVRLLDLTGGRRKVTFTYAPTKLFDRVRLTLGGGIANVLSSLNLYEAQRVIPSPVIKINNVVATSTSICTGSSATLTATAVPNTVFNWYTVQTGGAPVHTGATFTTPALTATTTYYVEAQRTGCTDASARTAITITVNQIPAAPVVANANLTVCQGQATTFTATTIAGVTVNWYSSATGGTVLHTGDSFTTPALSATTSYYAEAVAGGTCVSTTRTKVTATVSTPPDAPILNANTVSICDGDVAVLAVKTPVAGITYNWYSTATGGTSVFTGPTFTTAALHANTIYYVEATNAGGCTSTTRAQASVTVVPKPANPILSANNTTVAAGQTATIGVTNAQTGVTYNFYTSNTAATPVFTGTTFTTPALFATTTYYVSAVNSTGCTSAARTAITINVTINNNSPCSFANVQTSSVNGLCIGCSVTNNVLSTDADTTTASTINVLAGLLGGYVDQTLQFQQAGVAKDTIKLVISAPAALVSAAVLGQIQLIVQNGAATVNSYTLGSNLITLRLLSGATNRYVVLIPTTGTYDRLTVRLNSGVVGLLTSLNIYYAAQQFQTPVLTVPNPEVCKGSAATLTLKSPAAGTYNWFSTPTGGTSLHTGTTYTTAALNSNTTYYIEYTRGSCVSPTRYPVQITVDDPPAAPTVTTQNVTVNSGQPATLNATAANGATIKWYSAATGGTALFTGNTYTTPALTANTTYYAEAVTGSCTSPTRTPVTVTVTPVVIPNVTVTPATQAVNPGSTATFTASSTTPGVTFNWYTTPTGGTSIFTGATFTTPAEYAGTTYYAEAKVIATGAVSATRATGKVTINSTAANPTPCDAAIDQTTATSGVLCIGCSIDNPTGSVDADRNTFSRLNVPIGLVNSYAQQTLRFANTGLAGDSVVVELGYPGALADVSVLSQISLATYNGATYNNDRFAVDPSLIRITLLNGTSRFRIAFKATANFDRVEIRLNAALVGVLNSLNIYDASQEVPAPTISTASVNVCQGSSATVTATAASDATIRWYTTASGGSPVFTGAVFTTPALNTTTTYYAEASRTADGCAQTVRTPVKVTVSPIPSAPTVATPNVTVCSGSPATFSVTPVSGVTYEWFSSATGGTALATGNSFTSPALTSTTSYYVEAENAGSCGSSTRTQVTANVTTTPNAPAVGQTSVQTCSGSSATLTASSTQPGVTFNWYTAATGGTPVATGAQFTTPALTANTSYYVEAASGSCVSATRTEVDVTANPLPANPTVSVTPAGGQITSGQTATLTASSTTANVTFKWYTAASGGTAIATGPTFTTPALTSNMTYYVEAVSNATGCTSATRTPVTVTVNAIFSTSCDFANTQTSDVNGGLACIGCSVTNGNNAVDSDTTNSSQLNLPIAVLGSYASQTLIFGDKGAAGDTVRIKIGLPVALATVGVLDQLQVASYNGATYNNDRTTISSSLIRIVILSGGQTAIIKFVPKTAFDRVEVRLLSGLAVLSSANVFYASKQVAAPVLAAGTVNICSGSTATFTVTNAKADVTYKWYTAAVGGTLVHTGTSYTTGALTATTTYYVEASRTANGCTNPNRVSATVNVTPAPVTPTLTQASLQVCAGDQVSFSVNNAAGATVNWYDAPTGGTLLFTGATYVSSPIASTKYYAEITNGTCTSPSRAVATVTVNPRPAAPTVQSTNVQVCANSPATLTVLNPEAGVNYLWYTQATGGTAVFTGNSYTTPAITANTTFYVEASNATSSCTNNGGRTAVNITINNTVSSPTLSNTSIQVCNGGSSTVSVVNPVNGLQYSWYTSPTGGAPVFTGTSYTLTNVLADAKYYVEASNAAGCTSTTRTELDVTVIPVPTPPQVQAQGGSLSVCSGSSATLSIVNPQADMVYRWYDAAANGTLLYTGTQFNTPALTATTTYYVEAAQAGNCNASARTSVTITVNAAPADPTLAIANVSVCPGSSATLTIASPQAGITYQWFDSPALTNKLFEGTSFVTAAITANVNYYVVAVNASGCQSNNVATAQVTISQPPASPVIANGNPAPGCVGSALTLTISNPQTGFTYNWYSASTGGTPIATGNSFTTPVLSGNVTYYVDAVAPGGCVSGSRTKVDVDVNTLPANPVVTQAGSATPSVCSGSAATLTATSTTANVTFNWYNVATGGTPVFTGATYTTPAITTATTYYVEAVSNAGGCTSASRTSVQVTINNNPAQQPTVNAADLSVCQNTAAVIHITNPDAATTYNWYAAATGGSPLYTGSAFTTSALSANTTYYVDATDANHCQPSARLTVNVVIVPRPATPVPTQATLTACMGMPALLSVQSPQSGITYSWYDSPSKTHLLATGSSYTTDNINANTTFYVDASNGSCSSSALASVQVNVTAPPAAPMLTSTSASTCSGTQVMFSIANPQSGYTYNWYSSASGGSSLGSGSTFNTPVVTSTITFYAEAVNATGCTSSSRTAATVTVSPAPNAPTVNAPGSALCPNSSTTLTATNSDPNITIKWYANATGGTALATGNSFTTPVLTGTTSYYAEASNGTVCTSASRTQVTVNVLQQLETPVVTVSNVTPTTVTFSWNAISGATGYEASLDGGNAFTPVTTGTSFTVTGLLPLQSVTIVIRAISGSACQMSANSAAVTGKTSNPLGDVVWIPNAFSPNGDGRNDILLVYGNTIKSLTFYVYDQWGNMIYQSSNKDQGWDGTWKGKNQPVGVYVYYVEAILNDGQHITKKGTINLLR